MQIGTTKTAIECRKTSYAEHFPAYAINLKKSQDRFKKLRDSAAKFEIDLIRVDAVDGYTVPRKDRKGLHEFLFWLRCGRRSLPGEYGCYQSHLKALEMVAAGPDAAALIVEDDVEFADRFVESVAGLVEMMPKCSVLKVVNHRSGGFLAVGELHNGVEVGVCAMGPQGSAAGYLVTKQGAARLCHRLKRMSLPFDVALERAWATGVSVFTVRENLLPFAGGQRGETLIATSADYRSVKFFRLMRVPSYLFKGIENILRMIYAFSRVLVWRASEH